MEPKPVARSPVYNVPYIGSRTKAKFALMRNKRGRIDEALMAAGESCAEIEKIAVEICREKGVPQTGRNICVVEEGAAWP